MKVFAVIFAVIVATVAVVSASGYGGSSGGSSYGGSAASIPAPPCPKNYLFSCQPSLAPAPCAAQPAASYGSAGAYSENVPSYVNAPYGLNGVQGYVGYQGVQGFHY